MFKSQDRKPTEAATSRNQCELEIRPLRSWIDAIRYLHPDEKIYTFWDCFRNAFGRDAGLRIDHLLLSPSVAERPTAANVDRDVRGWEKASDHAPTWIELRAAKRARRTLAI
jgi:exodeoxyribonuclease III